MAFLQPDRTFAEHGLTIKEKLITPFSGVKYYSRRKLDTPGSQPQYITIHNTEDISEAAGTSDAEQYARATFNNNMGDVVVHYYIDETDCWHILADDTVGWHAADGANGPGNTKSIAVEIIMDGSGKPYDTQAEDRGALLAAILLHRYGLGIDRLKTHRDWYPKKYCPAYLLPHWNDFVEKVNAYLAGINAQDAAKKDPAPDAARQPAGEASDAEKKTYYRVQVGYYSVKAYAEATRQKLKEAGFPAIIKEETV